MQDAPEGHNTPHTSYNCLVVTLQVWIFCLHHGFLMTGTKIPRISLRCLKNSNPMLSDLYSSHKKGKWNVIKMFVLSNFCSVFIVKTRLNCVLQGRRLLYVVCHNHLPGTCRHTILGISDVWTLTLSYILWYIFIIYISKYSSVQEQHWIVFKIMNMNCTWKKKC